MAINKSHPMRFTPKGLSDAYDSTDEFPGACQSLANLVFDQSNPEITVARPGTVSIVNFITAGFSNPQFISVQVTIGTRTYGLISTGLNAGKDQPFIYDNATGTFVPLTGVTGAKSPFSPSPSGEWTPPTIANVGVMVLVTHPGFTGTANKIGWFDVTVPAAPTWNAGDTVTTALVGVPTAVANFNNRAYFSYTNILQFTDALTNPPTITSASQSLTIGDNTAIVALAGLPVQTTSSGVAQSLTVFKNSQCWQVTGDSALLTLSLNYLSLTIGTTAPRSVAQSTTGLYFISTGGPYFINALGAVSALTYSGDRLEPDIQVPFQNANTTSRWAGAYASSIYRVCGPTVLKGQQVTNDYWFDEHKRRWNGPHSYAYDCASVLGGNFILSSANNPGQMGLSTVQANSTSVFADLSSSYQCRLLSSTFPKVGDMAQKQVAESTIELEASLGLTVYTVQAQDEQGVVLGQAVMQVDTGGANWGAFVWGDGTLWAAGFLWGSGNLWGSTAQGGSNQIWRSGQQIPSTYPVAWATPLVFDKMQLQVETAASAQVGIGTFYARYQITGYQDANAITTSNTAGVTSGSGPGSGAPAVSGTLIVQDEGVTQSTAVNTLNFVGVGVSATGTASLATIVVSTPIPNLVLDFGADPTGSVDSSPALQAFFNSTDGAVIVPNGNYRVNNTVTITNGVSKRIIGNHWANTTFYNANSGIRLFEYVKSNASSATSSYVTFENVTFDGGAVLGTAISVGVWWQGFDSSAGGHQCWLRMRDCVTRNLLYGVYGKWAGFCVFENTYALNNSYGWVLDRDCSFWYFKGCTALGGFIGFSCVDTVSPGDGVSNGLFFEQCSAVGNSLEDYIVNGWELVMFDECSADLGSGGLAAVYLANTNDWHWHNGWIASSAAVATRRGLWSLGTTGAGSRHGSAVGATFNNSYRNVQIDGTNTFGTDIKIDDCKFETINANTVNHLYLGDNATSVKFTNNHVMDSGVALANPIATSGVGNDYHVVRHNTFGKAAGAWFPPAGIGAASLAETVNNIFGVTN